MCVCVCRESKGIHGSINTQVVHSEERERVTDRDRESDRQTDRQRRSA